MSPVTPSTTHLMNRRITLGFLAAVVLIAAGFTISLYSYHRHGEDTAQVRHTYEVMGTLEKTLSTVKDVELSARSFALTGDSVYLKAHHAYLRKLPSLRRQLHELVADNAVQQQRERQFEQALQRKLAFQKNWFQQIDQHRALLIHESKKQLDDLRWQVGVMIESERVLMEARNRQADRSFRNTIVLIFAVSLLTFVVLGLSYRQLERELRQRQVNEEQLRQYEITLRNQIRQLETSNEELERFAFVASHDLQEPLRKIQSFSHLITERYSTLFDGDSQLYMTKIAGSAERMSRLIKDLLNFSRITSQQEALQMVPLGKVIQRILDDQELRLKGMAVRLEVGPLPTVPAVASQIDHLFTNLISNALKFVRKDVRPLLRIQSRPVDGAAYPGLVAGDSYVEITVEDNGIGFEEKYNEHIFKLFGRLHGKNAFEGTGIGLAICKRVVMSHLGYIVARSIPGEGTTFVVVLPMSHSAHYHDRTAETRSYFAG